MEGDYRAHVMVLPFHGQGHVNPMVQFSKRLASKGIKVTVAANLSTTKSLPAQVGSISLESIYDDLGEGGIHGPGSFRGFLERFQASCSKNLEILVKKHEGTKYPIKCLVYDANLPWAVDLAKQLGISAAAFFTQSCAAIVHYQEIGKNNSVEAARALVRNMPELDNYQLPSVGSEGQLPTIIRFVLIQFSNIGQADWIIFNSFHKLEEEVVKELSKTYRIITIGPTLPSNYLDKRLEGDKEYGFNLFKADGDACMKWLNSKQTGSVVYVSFGSAKDLREEQMQELALGLKQSDRNFLWVVKASEEKKLPNKFVEETSEKGLVVTWCPQLEVLSHQAVGCFVTHCGWNSTLEGVSLGVPMLAMPQFLDQFSNGEFIEEVWKVGLRPKVDEKGIASKEEIQECIREILEGVKGEEMKKNAKKWKELAREAVDEGGSSDKHIENFAALLSCN